MAWVSAVTASSYLPSLKARTPVSKYVWASWAASGIALQRVTRQSSHHRIDRRIAFSLLEGARPYVWPLAPARLPTPPLFVNFSPSSLRWHGCQERQRFAARVARDTGFLQCACLTCA